MRRVLLLALLAAGAALAPAGGADMGIDWAGLQRPFQLPALGANGACPLSRAAPEITGARYGVGGAFGEGPVYPLLGQSSNLVTGYRPEEWGRGPWAGQKVLWFALPSYDGPVL